MPATVLSPMSDFRRDPTAQVVELASLQHEIIGSPTSRRNGRANSRGWLRLRVRITSRVLPPAAGRRWKPQIPLHGRLRPQIRPRIEGPTRQQAVARRHYQRPIRL
jgi:hypothetical protein